MQNDMNMSKMETYDLDKISNLFSSIKLIIFTKMDIYWYKYRSMEQNEIEENKNSKTRINLKYILMNIRSLTEVPDWAIYII
jgi:hypothetical protein